MNITTYRITNEKKEPLLMTIKETIDEFMLMNLLRVKRKNGDVIIFYDRSEDVLLPIGGGTYMVLPKSAVPLLSPDARKTIIT